MLWLCITFESQYSTIQTQIMMYQTTLTIHCYTPIKGISDAGEDGGEGKGGEGREGREGKDWIMSPFLSFLSLYVNFLKI